ncbi:MAG: 50S ribosomal protein L11 methyltransferase [Flavobacteriales bacterium]|nr:50S ribosomal protein L11 methyltransferase [Flavobacteriales bacterium]
MYLEFKIFCPDELKEVFQAELMYNGFEGLWDNKECLYGYIQEDELDMDGLKEILGRYDLIESYSFKPVENLNWNESWEQSFEPIRIGDHCIIRASFHKPEDLKYEIIITPKMSFGTGHHETTYMMAAAILDLDMQNKIVLDMGCGSGVLAILSEKKGAKSVLAIDHDNWAISNTEENLLSNNCTRISVLKRDGKFQGNFDVILSNINRNINLEMIPLYAEALNKKGILLLSGFYHHDVNAIENKAQEYRLRVNKVQTRNDWACIELTNEI